MSSYTQLSTQQRFAQVKRVLWVILLLNLLVAAAKFIYGVMTRSAAMQADGIHSVFDSAGNIVGIIGLSLAARPADLDHPYGHSKFETYASVAIGVMLVLAGINIGTQAVKALVYGEAQPIVNAGSFAVMIITLIINIAVTLYERKQGKKLKSEILVADALHTFSDALVSISVIVSLVFVQLGFVLADSIASLVVAAAILYAAYGVLKQANATLSDEARIDNEKIERVAVQVEGVENVHAIRTRGTEAEVYVDLHILVHPSTTIYRAHALADEVEANLRHEFPQIVDVLVHIEPDTESERAEAALLSE